MINLNNSTLAEESLNKSDFGRTLNFQGRCVRFCMIERDSVLAKVAAAVAIVFGAVLLLMPRQPGYGRVSHWHLKPSLSFQISRWPCRFHQSIFYPLSWG